jgi:hypothetical protein
MRLQALIRFILSVLTNGVDVPDIHDGVRSHPTEPYYLPLFNNIPLGKVSPQLKSVCANLLLLIFTNI